MVNNDKKLPKKKSSVLDDFPNELYEIFKELTPILSYICKKKLKRKEYFQTHFTKPALFQYQNQTKILHKKIIG